MQVHVFGLTVHVFYLVYEWQAQYAPIYRPTLIASTYEETIWLIILKGENQLILAPGWLVGVPD